MPGASSPQDIRDLIRSGSYSPQVHYEFDQYEAMRFTTSVLVQQWQKCNTVISPMYVPPPPDLNRADVTPASLISSWFNMRDAFGSSVFDGAAEQDDKLFQSFQTGLIWMSEDQLWIQTARSEDALVEFVTTGSHSKLDPSTLARIHLSNPQYEADQADIIRCLRCLQYLDALPEKSGRYSTLPITQFWTMQREADKLDASPPLGVTYNPTTTEANNTFITFVAPNADDIQETLEVLAVSLDPSAGIRFEKVDDSASELGDVPFAERIEYAFKVLSHLPADEALLAKQAINNLVADMMAKALSLATLTAIATRLSLKLLSAYQTGDVLAIFDDTAKILTAVKLTTKALWALARLTRWLVAMAWSILPKSIRNLPAARRLMLRTTAGLRSVLSSIGKEALYPALQKAIEQWWEHDNRECTVLNDLFGALLDDLIAKVYLIVCSKPQLVEQRVQYYGMIQRCATAFKEGWVGNPISEQRGLWAALLVDEKPCSLRVKRFSGLDINTPLGTRRFIEEARRPHCFPTTQKQQRVDSLDRPPPSSLVLSSAERRLNDGAGRRSGWVSGGWTRRWRTPVPRRRRSRTASRTSG